ncbi:MAG: Ig-like domain repeat protein [Nakamurella sp.]
MRRPRTRHIIPALLIVLLLAGASIFAAGTAFADSGTRDTIVGVSVVQPPDFGPITVGGQIAIRMTVGDDSGKCINFFACDQPSGTVDVTFQNADLSYNQPVLTADLAPDGSTGGQVVMTIDNPLPAGTYHVDAHYYGDDNFHPNDGTLDNVIVAPLTPDVGITQSSTSSYQGDPVTFSASVGSPNGVHPTGTVQLIYGMTTIGGPTPLDSSGNASITRTDLPVSDSSGHTYYFHYSGNYVGSGHGFLNAADSNSIDHQTLTKTPTTTTVVLTTPVRRDDPVDIIGGVSAAGGIKPPGSVTFTAFVGGIPFGSTTATLSGGIVLASFAADTLFPASYTVVALYHPSDLRYGASSATTDLVITVPTPLPGVVLAVTATPNPGELGAPETLHVIATPPVGSTASVDGVIRFATGMSILGTCTLAPAAGDTAACDMITSALPAGVDPITVSYPGSTRYAGATTSISVTISTPATPIPTATPTSGSGSVSATTTSATTTGTASSPTTPSAKTPPKTLRASIEVLPTSNSVRRAGRTTSSGNIEVFPTSMTTARTLAFTGADTFGLGMVALLLLLGGGALILLVGSGWRRKPGKH